MPPRTPTSGPQPTSEPSSLGGLDLSTVLERTRDCVFLIDPEWRIAYLNARARARIVGRRELVGERAPDSLPGLFTGDLHAACVAALRQGATTTCDAAYPPLGAWFEANVFPYTGGVAVFLHDVTDLREATERYRLALSAAEMGDWSWDAATDLMSFSDRAREIFGFAPGEEVTRTRLRSFCHPDDLAAAERIIEEAAQARTRYRVEYRYHRPSDGVTRWLLTMGHARSRLDGALKGITGVVLDVTEAKVAEQKQQILVRELHHRVKNTLATVQAMVGATARSAPTAEEFYASFLGRILSLASTHNLLTDGPWQTASLKGLLEAELSPYDNPAKSRIVLAGPRVELGSEDAVPVGMAIHELTTNAAKYGALSTPAGRLSVTWELERGEDGRAVALRLHWCERDGPPVTPPARLGFGSKLLRRVLTTQLQAEVEVNFAREGFELRLRAPTRGALPDGEPGRPSATPAGA